MPFTEYLVGDSLLAEKCISRGRLHRSESTNVDERMSPGLEGCQRGD